MIPSENCDDCLPFCQMTTAHIFFSASRTVFKLKKINIPKAFWDHFVTTHFKFSFSFLAPGFQQNENTCRLHFLPTHSFCNQLQPPSLSYNASEITLNKINVPHLIIKSNGLFLFLILFPSAAIPTMTIFPLQYHPGSDIYYSCIIATILQFTSIIPISANLPVNHSQVSPASSTPVCASPAPLWVCSGPSMTEDCGKRRTRHALPTHVTITALTGRMLCTWSGANTKPLIIASVPHHSCLKWVQWLYLLQGWEIIR